MRRLHRAAAVSCGNGRHQNQLRIPAARLLHSSGCRHFSVNSTVPPSVSSTPYSSFLSEFEKTAGPLPGHISLPTSSPPRPAPPHIITRSVSKLDGGITRIVLDVGVHDTAPQAVSASAVQESREETMEAEWRRRKRQPQRDPALLNGDVEDLSLDRLRDMMAANRRETEQLPSEFVLQPPTAAPSLASQLDRETATRLPGLDYVPCIMLLPPRPSSSLGSNPLYPAMLCLHQTTVPASVGKEEPTSASPSSSLAYACELSRRGYITLSPDYPLYGEYQLDLDSVYAHYASVTMKAIVNNIHCIDLLTHWPLVDPTRIGAIGHSLGGSNALFTAAVDDRIAAVVSSAGFTSFSAYRRSRYRTAGSPPTAAELSSGTAYDNDLRGWSRRDKYMPLIAAHYGNDCQRLPWQWSRLLAWTAAARDRGIFISAPTGDLIFPCQGVKDAVDEARKSWRQQQGQEAAEDERLLVVYPEGGHEFPAAVRQQAYDWLDRRMRHQPFAALQQRRSQTSDSQAQQV